MRYFLIGLIMFASCSVHKPSLIIAQQIKSFDTCKHFSIIIGDKTLNDASTGTKAYFQYFSTKALRKISTELLNNPYGHYFAFRTSGELSRYRYLAGDSLHHCYEVDYNIKSERYLEQGNAYVGNMDNIISDTAYKRYSLLFSYFPRTNVSVSISTDSLYFRKLDLHNSNFMPMLGEYDYDARKDEKYLFLRIEASSLLIDLPNLPDTVITTRKIYF